MDWARIGCHADPRGWEARAWSVRTTRCVTRTRRCSNSDASDALARIRDLLAWVDRLGWHSPAGSTRLCLLALAVRAWARTSVVAILGVSPSLAADERAAAHGSPNHRGPAGRGRDPRGRSRRLQRERSGPCFHCKDELFTRSTMRSRATHRLDAVAYGENADDAARPDRPGARAATKHRVCGRSRTRAWTRRPYAGSPGHGRCLPPTSPPPHALRPGSRTFRASRLRSCGRSIRPRLPCGGSALTTCGSGTTARWPGSS